MFHEENQTTLDWWPTHFNPTGYGWFAISDPTRTVDEVMSTPSDYVGEELQLSGEVRDSSINNESMTFLLSMVLIMKYWLTLSMHQSLMG